MTKVHLTTSSATARIPLRRFTMHFLLSALAAAIPQLLQLLAYAFPGLQDIIPSMIWSFTITGGFVIHILREGRHPSRMEFSPCCRYGMAASALVAAQHWVTILLGGSVGGADPGFTNRQHIAVHFCLVFYAITELEFYRAYTLFETFETYTDLLKYLPLANVDPSFPYSREPICYMTDLPNSWRCYLDGGNDPTTFWAIAFSKSHNVLFASHLLFHLVWRLANYPLKKIVNPAPEYDSYSAIVNGPILFGTYPASVWEVLLGLALLRVVRQANYVGFWAVVRLLERTRGR
jgi:hypothetical protein